jgi:MraZ protein
MLIGEYIHTLDDKNRLSLPAKFRAEMGKKLVLTPGLDGAIFMFTEKEWKVIAEKLSGSSMLATDNRSFNRFMFGGAVETAVDGAGRILVPDFLKERAGIKGKVAVVGVQNRVELWSDTNWATYKRDVDAQANDLAGRLGTLGVL